MKLTVTIHQDEDGAWTVQCPSIPGCVSQGHTKDEALANIREAIALRLEARPKSGIPLTIETHQVEVPLPQQPQSRLNALLAGVTQDNLHPEINTGPPVGKEVW